MIRIALPIFLLLFCTCTSRLFSVNQTGGLCAQATLSADAVEYLYEVSRKVDPDRYSEVRGTPYRYKDFGPTEVYDITLNKYLLDSANFNGFTSQFEFYIDGILRELEPNNFIRVTVLRQEGDHKYARGINPKFRDRYALITYKGDNIVATMVYDVKNDEKIVQDVGKTIKLRRFSAKSLHFAMVDGDLVPITLTPKKVAADLGFKKELGIFIKTEKLKPNKPEDLLRIYQEADKLANQ